MLQQIKYSLALMAISLLPALPALAVDSAVPGTVNYVEGQVSVAGQPVTSRAVGSVQIQPNQVLETGQGRAEVLLTPGVFLRVGNHSAVRLLSPNLANTQVELLNGQAIVEVTELFKDNNLSVLMDGASTRLDKQGLYAFDANTRAIRVLDGKATVLANDRNVDLGKGKELLLAGRLKGQHFDAKAVAEQDPLYAWSNLRSEYEAEASMQSARAVFVGGGPYWYGPGWYWNPYWDMYGFIPGAGIWYSPFGWPFYSPYVAYWGGGFGYGGFGYGYGHGYLARGHGHVTGAHVGIGSGGRFGASARLGGGGFAGHGFAGGMRGGFGGGFGGGGRR
ncbi:MAG TPA: hypothetical protein VME17_11595 [Bryobacteraceae bacterium]|nr:hypothetical protein [Bryobacteraceae bacterium]